MAPTWHPHTSQLWEQREEGGFTPPASTEPIQKLILPAQGFKKTGQPPAPRMRRRSRRRGRTGVERGGRGNSGRMTSPSLKCHHYLKLQLSRLERWHHPLYAPPLSPSAWWGSLFVCMKACARGKAFICFFTRGRHKWEWMFVCAPSFISWQKAASVTLFLSRSE